MWSIFSRDPSKDFGYEIGDIVTSFEGQSVWTLLKGTKKATHEPVSIFKLEITPSTSRQAIDVAKAALKRFKTLRHPSFITYIDSFESDKLLCVVTEQVQPLKLYLDQLNGRSNEEKTFTISYGIYQISHGLSFLNNDVSLQHNNVHLGSIFVNSAAIWKIGALEYITSCQENHWPNKLTPSLEKYDPPEKSSSQRSGHHPNWARDAYGLGCFIYECFNGELQSKTALTNHGRIPKTLRKEYDHLILPNPSARCNFNDFLAKARTNGRFLKNNFVDAMIFLDELQLKDQIERNRFFNSLNDALDHYPADICINKVLPQLITAFEYQNAGASMLSPLLKLGKLLPPKDYELQVVPCLVKLFSCKDRATRAKLLQQMDMYVHHLKTNIVNEQLYVHVCQGFVDSNPTIREQTVKCMLYLASKLSYANLNEDMLKHFSRLQVTDPECSIRTNTTVCLGKVAAHLNPQIRQTMLIPAFLRSMRDPFAPARVAAIQALEATQQFYSLQETATKVMPALCHMTMDQEKSVRDAAFKVLKELMDKIEQVSKNPAVAEKFESQLNAAGSAPNSSTAASWASWAVSSFTSKLAKISNKPDDAKETTESIGVSAGKPTDSPINKNESIIDRSTTPNSGSTATRLESMSIDAKQSSISGDSIDEWDPEAFGTLDEEGTQTIKKVTEGWDQDDDDEDWKDFENDPNPPKSDVKPLFASIHKTAVAKSSFGKMELAEDHEPEEYSYTSKKSDKKSTDDDLWASLGGSGLNLRSAAASCKSGRTQEDELFANLNQPVKKTTSRLQAGQKKRGPLKLGAQKM